MVHPGERATVRRTVKANPRGGETRLCLACMRWGACAPSAGCAHPSIVDLAGASPERIHAVESLAESVVRAREQAASAIGAIGLIARELCQDGSAHVALPELPANVVFLRTSPRETAQTRKKRGFGEPVRR